MGLFLVLFWCSAVLGDVLGYNSRFGVFSSRLGRQKFPVHSTTGIRRQSFDLLYPLSQPDRWLPQRNRKFPVPREKPGILSPPTEAAVAQPTDNGGDLWCAQPIVWFPANCGGSLSRGDGPPGTRPKPAVRYRHRFAAITLSPLP